SVSRRAAYWATSSEVRVRVEGLSTASNPVGIDRFTYSVVDFGGFRRECHSRAPERLYRAQRRRGRGQMWAVLYDDGTSLTTVSEPIARSLAEAERQRGHHVTIRRLDDDADGTPEPEPEPELELEPIRRAE